SGVRTGRNGSPATAFSFAGDEFPENLTFFPHDVTATPRLFGSTAITLLQELLVRRQDLLEAAGVQEQRLVSVPRAGRGPGVALPLLLREELLVALETFQGRQIELRQRELPRVPRQFLLGGIGGVFRLELDTDRRLLARLVLLVHRGQRGRQSLRDGSRDGSLQLLLVHTFLLHWLDAGEPSQ